MPIFCKPTLHKSYIQNKYQKYMTYIIKCLCIKFTYGHNLSNLKILNHAKAHVCSNGWEKKNSLPRSPGAG